MKKYIETINEKFKNTQYFINFHNELNLLEQEYKKNDKLCDKILLLGIAASFIMLSLAVIVNMYHVTFFSLFVSSFFGTYLVAFSVEQRARVNKEKFKDKVLNDFQEDKTLLEDLAMLIVDTDSQIIFNRIIDSYINKDSKNLNDNINALFVSYETRDTRNKEVSKLNIKYTDYINYPKDEKTLKQKERFLNLL